MCAVSAQIRISWLSGVGVGVLCTRVQAAGGGVQPVDQALAEAAQEPEDRQGLPPKSRGWVLPLNGVLYGRNGVVPVLSEGPWTRQDPGH